MSDMPPDLFGAVSPYDPGQYGASVPPIYTPPASQLDALLGGMQSGHGGVSIANGSRFLSIPLNPIGTPGAGNPGSGFVGINALGSSLLRFLAGIFSWA